MNEKQRKAYEWVKAHGDYCSLAARHAQALAELVDELRAGWISVEERLPEESGVYIVHDISMGIRVFYFGKGEVRSGWFGVTHWMPLPEPPEVEG